MIPKIPKDPSWCAPCTFPTDYGYEPGQPCEHHRAANGSPKPCDKAYHYDIYEPSTWVQEVVGSLFHAWDGFTYLVTGYDPRAGFNVERVATDEKRKANISERAIDRTFKRLRGPKDAAFRAKHGIAPHPDVRDPAYQEKHNIPIPNSV